MILENWFVRSATWVGLVNQNGSCTPRLIDLTTKLAEGDVGLIITGITLMANPNNSFSSVGKRGTDYEQAAKRYKEQIGIPLILVGGMRSYGE